MSTPTVEERLTALEVKVEEIKQQRETDKSDESVPWWERFVGIHADSPGFEEAVRFGQEWRAVENALDDENTAA
jgi:hypothetical protein